MKYEVRLLSLDQNGRQFITTTEMDSYVLWSTCFIFLLGSWAAFANRAPLVFSQFSGMNFRIDDDKIHTMVYMYIYRFIDRRKNFPTKIHINEKRIKFGNMQLLYNTSTINL